MFSECNTPETKEVSLTVGIEVLPRFTTLLQNGIYLTTPQGATIRALLADLPGFTDEYVSQRVQTIFLNGLPADDLQQQLFGTEAVLALSGAMPGLAGAIFRKDGVHASLRTKTADKLSDTNAIDQPLQIRVKLFNIIAVERGAQILNVGCTIQASALGKFLAYRPPLFAAIDKVTMNDKHIEPQTLSSLLQTEKMITLTIRSSGHGS
ncbi:MAG: hypothetical protein K9K37_03230 [Desulfocapsa sp.]|nr:hypothetical protein [Desulfocapsa sp.]